MKVNLYPRVDVFYVHRSSHALRSTEQKRQTKKQTKKMDKMKKHDKKNEVMMDPNSLKTGRGTTCMNPKQEQEMKGATG